MGENLVDLSQLTKVGRISNDFSQYGEYYIFSHITRAKAETVKLDISMPMRFGGFMFLLCMGGGISVDINLQRCDIRPNNVAFVGPDAVVKVNSMELEELDVYTLFLSNEFIRDINMDTSAFNPRMFVRKRDNHILPVSDEEMTLLKRYFELLHHNTSDNTSDIYIKNISRCLVACIAYQTMQFAERRLDECSEETPTVSRRMNYIHDFIELVHTHHRTQRSVGYYAGKLFISPKYLSLIVKEATRRSAAEWIDEYVILEAKNMLRFSGKNIQQVAYELNFTSQSSFGKYFKHLTGMSPSEFLKT